MHFKIIGEITDVHIIATGNGIKDVAPLRQQFGPSRWRRLKGIALIELAANRVRLAELH